jgi:hypothetical protein
MAPKLGPIHSLEPVTAQLPLLAPDQPPGAHTFSLSHHPHPSEVVDEQATHVLAEHSAVEQAPPGGTYAVQLPLIGPAAPPTTQPVTPPDGRPS